MVVAPGRGARSAPTSVGHTGPALGAPSPTMVPLRTPHGHGAPQRTRWRIALAVVALVAAGGSHLPTAPAGAGAPPTTDAGPDQPLPPDQPVIPDDRLAPELAGVPVEGDDVELALGAYRRTEARLTDAVALAERSDVELAELAEAESRLVRRLTEARRRQDKSARRLAELAEGLRGLVVADYVRGGTGSVNDPTVDLADLEANDRRRVLVEAAYGFTPPRMRYAGGEENRSRP